MRRYSPMNVFMNSSVSLHGNRMKSSSVTITSTFSFGYTFISSKNRIRHSSGSFTETVPSTLSWIRFSSITQNITSARTVISGEASDISITRWII